MPKNNNTDDLNDKLNQLKTASKQSRKKSLIRFTFRWILTLILAIVFWEHQWARWILGIAIVLGIINIFLVFKQDSMIKKFVDKVSDEPEIENTEQKNNIIQKDIFKLGKLDATSSKNHTVGFDGDSMDIELKLEPTHYDAKLHSKLFSNYDGKTQAGIRISVSDFFHNADIAFDKAHPSDRYDTTFWFDGFAENMDFKGDISAKNGLIEILGELVYDTETDENSSTSISNIPFSASVAFDKTLLDLTDHRFNSLASTVGVDKHLVQKLYIKESFDQFPKEVLQFKSLEELGFWSGEHRYNQLPDEIGELTNLKLLSLHNSQLTSLPVTFSQLKKLKYLSITNSNITHISDSLCQLTQLNMLTLTSNKLQTLPDCIGTLNLEHIDIKQNPFTSLPESLQNFKDLKIDQDKKSLFMDTRYPSKNSQAINQEIYRLESDIALFSKLSELIDKQESLLEYKTAIQQLARKTLYFETTTAEDYSQKGNTRFGGMPDLPPDIQHPKVGDDHCIFHAQINLAEIAHLQDYLPRKGILYFFVSDEEYVDKPIVFLSTAAVETLITYKYTEDTQFYDYHDGYQGFKAKIQIGFSLAEGYSTNAAMHGEYSKDLEKLAEQQYQIEPDPYHQLKSHYCPTERCDNIHSSNGYVFTQHESPEEQAVENKNGEINEWMNLLCLGWDKNTGYCFWDAGTLTYTIHKKDLAIGDFSNVVATIESS
jgi:uncharacterized protein YwqG